MEGNKLFLVAFGILVALTCSNGQTITTVKVSTTDLHTRFTSATGGGDTVRYCGGIDQVACVSTVVPPSRQIRWGTPFSSSSSAKSGLGFEGFTGIVNIDQEFYIGQLTHFNFQISSSSAVSATTLSIRVVVSATNNTVLGLADFAYDFDVDETKNTAPCTFPPDSNPCSDEITFANSGFTTGSFTINQVTYTVQLTGFKESQTSTSYSNPDFISQEDQQSVGYLFARITIACPNTCLGGGSYVITADNRCVCNCSTLGSCPGGQVRGADCSCGCADPNLCNHGKGGTLDPLACTCSCPNGCDYPKLLNPTNCDCTCDPTYCGTGTIANPATCSCNCNTLCGPNFVVNSTCGCTCPLNCGALTPPKVPASDPNICNCVCPPTTCPAGTSLDQNTCQCRCSRTCPNGQTLDTTTCTCGNCTGNWVKDDNGLCTRCGLTQADCGTASVDQDNCVCACDSTDVCSPLAGLVWDPVLCSCRQCGLQPTDVCLCGNGILEPGEQCDYNVSLGIINPCCENCQFTTASCNDRNLCTENDFCDGNDTCKGTYKCQQSDYCRSITCTPSIGNCVVANFANGTKCSDNMCEERCFNGVCTQSSYYGSCPNEAAIDDPSDCYAPVCNPFDGSCTFQPLNDTGCSDGDSCTTNDNCEDGVCVGEPLECDQPSDQCKIKVCDDGRCQVINLSDSACNADNSFCTVGDRCFGGVCIRGATKTCSTSNQCLLASCNAHTGDCNLKYRNGIPCDDYNLCTTNDTCLNGTCQGVLDPTTVDLTECGADNSSNNNVGQTTLIIFTVAGAAAILSAILGGAFLLKKVRDSRLLDPDTWNPDTFNSVEINPTYASLEKAFVNPLHEVDHPNAD